jgi:hypothetical protein
METTRVFPATPPDGVVSAWRYAPLSSGALRRILRGCADVGIRMVMEALDGAPAGMTWRERFVLQALAASAIDDTRECPPGIEDNPRVIERLHLGRSERYAVLKSLCEKGALMKMERGRNGVHATFAIPSYAAAAHLKGPGTPDASADPATPKGPGFPDASTAGNPSKGPETPDASAPGDGVKGPGSANEGSGFHPSKGPETPDASDGTQSSWDFRDFKTGGTTPPTPPETDPGTPPTPARGIGEDRDKFNGKQFTTREQILAVAGEACKLHPSPSWTTTSVIREMEKTAAAGRYPWPVILVAMGLVATDPTSRSPGRLRLNGDWWPKAERIVASRVNLLESEIHPFTSDGNGTCITCNLRAANHRHAPVAS